MRRAVSRKLWFDQSITKGIVELVALAIEALVCNASYFRILTIHFIKYKNYKLRYLIKLAFFHFQKNKISWNFQEVNFKIVNSKPDGVFSVIEMLHWISIQWSTESCIDYEKKQTYRKELTKGVTKKRLIYSFECTEFTGQHLESIHYMT